MSFVITVMPVLAALAGADTAESSLAADAFQRHAAFLADDALRGRYVGSPGNLAALEYMKTQLAQSGLVGGAGTGWTQSFPFEGRKSSDGRPMVGRNLIAILRGRGQLANEAIIVSTHHDHIGPDEDRIRVGADGVFNGADDNASGCAALLLIADAFRSDQTRRTESHRTVLFISFDGEEQGLVGSRWYVDHPIWPLDKTAANVNFDMVGRMTARRIYAFDSTSSPFLLERTKALALELGLNCSTDLHGTRRVDSVNFLDRRIPAVHLCTGIHADYHQVSDEPGRLNAVGGSLAAQLGYRLVRDAIETPHPIGYRQPDPTRELVSVLRLMGRLGLVPAVNQQSGKYPKVQWVIPGSIAAKAGVRSGDEITAIYGRQFERVEDAVALLQEFRVDRDLDLTVLRGGATVPLTVPAAAFTRFAGPEVKPGPNGAYEVTFRFVPPVKAQSVHLASTFNQWSRTATPMQGPNAKGEYTIRQTLAMGDHEYKFVVNGKDWHADPSNLYEVGVYGNSFLRLGPVEQSNSAKPIRSAK